jgi:hypothetical protein
MALQLSVGVSYAQLDALEATVGATAKLQLRTGAAPADCATAASGTLLAELTLPSDWMAAASGGVKSLAGTWTGAAVATGTVEHFRLVDNAGTTCHAQGTVTAGGGGGDMTIASTSITNGQTVNVNVFDITRGNA